MSVQSSLWLFKSSDETKCNCCSGQKMQKFIVKNFLVLGLLLALIIGLSYPILGEAVAALKVGGYSIVQTFNVCLIFFVSGFTLKTSEIKSAISSYPAFLYAILAILILTPLAGFVPLSIAFKPQEFAIGLAVFCAVPTTLTSGATLVMNANGNYALALMITVCSNVLGVLTTPFALKLILEGVVQGVSVDAITLLVQLLFTILLPLIVGKILRHINRNIRQFGKQHKTELSLVNNGSLIMVVWQTISQSQQFIVTTSITSILLLVVAGVLLHSVFLVFNSVVAKVAKWQKEEFRAVIIAASQKTLPVAVTVISYFGAAVGNKGLIVLPCIIAYLAQLFIDSFIVSRWNAIDAKNDEGKEEIVEVLIQDEVESMMPIQNEKQKGNIEINFIDYNRPDLDSLLIESVDKMTSHEQQIQQLNTSEDDDDDDDEQFNVYAIDDIL
eukprot:TRINITY_DN1156_c0_g1_i3.p1 TRINITY_DN1156_c0_g1~~TRINITY_DN1156_c0_g1_i3.p1  ORF type:complete len:442 (-),score=35.60 TRINITY_DN1156_c0_g1_i3:531-1856(-)